MTVPGTRPVKRHTRQGAAVADVMCGADSFRTAQEVHAELARRGQHIGLTTVYRHLNALVDAGHADVVRRGDGEARFKLCGAGSQDHHHHLVCRVCGRSEEVTGPQVERWAENVARAAGYTDVSHTLEVFGLCPEHSAPPPRKPRKTAGARR